MIERFFKVRQAGSSVRAELLGGLTTFLTMAYIVFVNPAVLSKDFAGNATGLSFDAVMLATCLSAAAATLIMGLLANYPIAQAPGMGENFFFVGVVMALAAAGVANAWRTALGIVFVSGILFLILSILPLRRAIIDAISPSLKNGIAVGIGVFITFIGLRNAEVIVHSPVTCVALNHRIGDPKLVIFFIGLVVTTVLYARRVRGAILIGIGVTTLVALVWGKTEIPGLSPGGAIGHIALLGAGVAGVLGGIIHLARGRRAAGRTLPGLLRAVLLLVLGAVCLGVFAAREIAEPHFFGLPKDHAFFRMDLAEAFNPRWLSFILVFLFMDMFDTAGTLIGVGEQAGFIKDNRLPRANRAMISDAAGTVVGAVTGTSTVTSYIESATGVQYGARTGLANVATGALFLAALVLAPLVGMVGNYLPITAPALVLVGAMMVRNVTKIDWADYSEVVPAFLAMVGIPLTYSIADGLALGFIAYPVVKVLAGRWREVSWMMVPVAVIFVLRYALM